MPDDATDETDETGPIAQPSWPSDPPPMANSLGDRGIGYGGVWCGLGGRRHEADSF